MSKKVNRNLTPKYLFYLISLILFLIFNQYLYSKYRVEPVDLIVEYHGLLFDILFFGIGFTIYETYRVKKERIQQLTDELNDFRYWKSEVAKYRILGILKRLKLLKVKSIDLSYCYFDDTFFGENEYSELKILDEFNMSHTQMRKCRFNFVSFKKTNLFGSSFNDSFFQGADFSNANLRGAQFRNVEMAGKISFREADLTNAQFNGDINFGDFGLTLKDDYVSYDFTNAILDGLIVNKNFFELLANLKGTGLQEIPNNYKIVSVNLTDKTFFKLEKNVNKKT